MPVYTLNPSHTRSSTHKASAAHSLRERVAARRRNPGAHDPLAMVEERLKFLRDEIHMDSEAAYREFSRLLAKYKAAGGTVKRVEGPYPGTSEVLVGSEVAKWQAAGKRLGGHELDNPRAKAPTRKDELMRLAHEAGYHVETYSPGDGVTRYRFFDLAEMDRKRVPMSEQTYFGPLNGVHTALGLAAAKKWLSKSNPRRHNPLSEDGMTVSNPKRPRYKVVAVAKPRSRSGGTAQKAGLAKGQSLMARAAAAYRAGEYASMQDALRGVARKRNPLIPVVLLPPTPPPKKTLRGAPVENPRRKGTKGKAKRSGGRTAAQSNAAKAMKLFHSGQASSLAEAWDMIRRGR